MCYAIHCHIKLGPLNFEKLPKHPSSRWLILNFALDDFLDPPHVEQAKRTLHKKPRHRQVHTSPCLLWSPGHNSEYFKVTSNPPKKGKGGPIGDPWNAAHRNKWGSRHGLVMPLALVARKSSTPWPSTCHIGTRQGCMHHGSGSHATARLLLSSFCLFVQRRRALAPRPWQQQPRTRQRCSKAWVLGQIPVHPLTRLHRRPGLRLANNWFAVHEL